MNRASPQAYYQKIQNYLPLGQQMPTNQNNPVLGQQMLTNQNYPPPGQHMQKYQNHPQPGKQDLTYQDHLPSASPKPPQQNRAEHQYVYPSQEVPWQQYAQPNPQQQYEQAQCGQQMPWQSYQQQQPPQPMLCQYYPQNTSPQYSSVVVAPPFQPPLQQWSNELFDCSQDPENCIITAPFSCLTFGQIAEITDHGMTSYATSGIIYGLLLYFTGFHWLYSFTYRQKLRAQYSLAEDPCLM